ncbi:MAG: hypothetical protein FWF11_00325 [Coriobacteriia bacterium]|nr:hypothetical protein [Coriobacteriia bacterium]
MTADRETIEDSAVAADGEILSLIKNLRSDRGHMWAVVWTTVWAAFAILNITTFFLDRLLFQEDFVISAVLGFVLLSCSISVAFLSYGMFTRPSGIAMLVITFVHTAQVFIVGDSELFSFSAMVTITLISCVVMTTAALLLLFQPSVRSRYDYFITTERVTKEEDKKKNRALLLATIAEEKTKNPQFARGYVLMRAITVVWAALVSPIIIMNMVTAYIAEGFSSSISVAMLFFGFMWLAFVVAVPLAVTGGFAHHVATSMLLVTSMRLYGIFDNAELLFVDMRATLWFISTAAMIILTLVVYSHPTVKYYRTRSEEIFDQCFPDLATKKKKRKTKTL